MFWNFWGQKMCQKVDGKMIFTDYWKVLVLNFSVTRNLVFFELRSWWKRWYLLIMEKFLFRNFSAVGNTVFFWGKKLTERWYLLVTQFLFWTFWWWEIRSFFSAKMLMERWYLLGLFELSMIFQDLWNTVFRAVKIT